MSLVFGCQSSETDHLYKEETLEMRRRGVLKSVTSAYSRQPGHPKVLLHHFETKHVLSERLKSLIESDWLEIQWKIEALNVSYFPVLCRLFLTFGLCV